MQRVIVGVTSAASTCFVGDSPRHRAGNRSVRRDAQHQRHRRPADLIALDNLAVRGIGDADGCPLGAIGTVVPGLTRAPPPYAACWRCFPWRTG